MFKPEACGVLLWHPSGWDSGEGAGVVVKGGDGGGAIAEKVQVMMEMVAMGVGVVGAVVAVAMGWGGGCDNGYGCLYKGRLELRAELGPWAAGLISAPPAGYVWGWGPATPPQGLGATGCPGTPPPGQGPPPAPSAPERLVLVCRNAGSPGPRECLLGWWLG